VARLTFQVDDGLDVASLADRRFIVQMVSHAAFRRSNGHQQ
jgi:hypothetical protein